MHPNNPFLQDYDLPKLFAAEPALESFAKQTKAGKVSLDFAAPEAVRLLNKALLKTQFKIEVWDIPKGQLCPPVPGRLDYLLHLADLLATTNEGKIPRGKQVRILDIGCGANCIYPILGNRHFGWRMVGTEVDSTSLKVARAIIAANPNLKSQIELRLQAERDQVFYGVTDAEERFAACVCNPPFYNSAQEAQAVNQRKWKQLGRGAQRKNAVQNFGGKDHEIWTKGGEKGFVLAMVAESERQPKLCGWFTSLLAKKKHETPIYQAIKRAKARQVEVIEMGQGNKASRMIAWRF